MHHLLIFHSSDQQSKYKKGLLLNVDSLHDKVLEIHKLFSYPDRLQHEVCVLVNTLSGEKGVRFFFSFKMGMHC